MGVALSEAVGVGREVGATLDVPSVSSVRVAVCVGLAVGLGVLVAVAPQANTKGNNSQSRKNRWAVCPMAVFTMRASVAAG